MKRKQIKTGDALFRFLNRLEVTDLACRGQNRVYDNVTPSLARSLLPLNLNIQDQLKVERATIQRFREHAPMFLSPVEQTYLQSQWLLLLVMQHYGAPTRLLDWTKSPWVAAYFAVDGCENQDGRIYIFRRDRLEEFLRKKHKATLGKLAYGPYPKDMKFPDNKWDTAKANDALLSKNKIAAIPELIAT